MRFDIVTIFPRMIEAALAEGILARAIQRELLTVRARDLREFTDDRHRTVDDVPYGGGPGMVLKPEPLFRAVEAIAQDSGTPQAVVLVSPHGRRFSQDEAIRLAGLDRVVILCGRYEGIDDRVRENLATEELSIGDYVVSGGELPALVVVDAVARLIPGVVGDEDSVAGDSFARGILDFPHFTRPAEFRDWKVPDVLVSGHHGEIRRWRKRQALELTLKRRPDLLADAELDLEEQDILRELMERKKGAAYGRD
ncbi:MAG TPA: tRNA (guanosine(37)-N1)-methyltransferase TrmD [Vicinamibacterales bacterium]|nr:tRNA (guanosine(37)-N1)-methyltransferase TrmD [Vicinamibacterales bacterium]